MLMPHTSSTNICLYLEFYNVSWGPPYFKKNEKLATNQTKSL